MDSSSVLFFFSHYGLWLLYIWLLIGIFILPVPEEAVMLTVGLLISKGTLSYYAYIVACLGSLSGATFSYSLGRFLGRPLVLKHGKWIGITKSRLELAEYWFDRCGKWALSIGYFTPGVRHLSALTSGTLDFDYKSFAIYCYPAGIVWVVTLVSLGYVAGAYWLNIYHTESAYIYYVILFVAVLFLLFFIVFWYIHHRRQKK